MNKRFFQVLDEMNVGDDLNKTDNVGVCYSFLGGTNGKQGSIIKMGAPQGALTKCFLHERIPILILLNKKEYDRLNSSNSPERSVASELEQGTKAGNQKDIEVYVPVDVKDELPGFSEDILVSLDGGTTFSESAAYRETRRCMLAGVGGGNGYFGEGFCSNGSTGCDDGLILPDVTHWLKKVKLSSLLTDNEK